MKAGPPISCCCCCCSPHPLQLRGIHGTGLVPPSPPATPHPHIHGPIEVGVWGHQVEWVPPSKDPQGGCSHSADLGRRSPPAHHRGPAHPSRETRGGSPSVAEGLPGSQRAWSGCGWGRAHSGLWIHPLWTWLRPCSWRPGRPAGAWIPGIPRAPGTDSQMGCLRGLQGGGGGPCAKDCTMAVMAARRDVFRVFCMRRRLGT